MTSAADKNGFTQSILFTPAYNTGKSCHGVNMEFALIGPKGAVALTVFTEWHLPETYQQWRQRGSNHLRKPSGSNLGYHAKKQRESEEYYHDKCLYTGGGCWSGMGSGTSAHSLFRRFVAEGEDVVWEELRSYYSRVFGESPE